MLLSFKFQNPSPAKEKYKHHRPHAALPPAFIVLAENPKPHTLGLPLSLIIIITVTAAVVVVVATNNKRPYSLSLGNVPSALGLSFPHLHNEDLETVRLLWPEVYLENKKGESWLRSAEMCPGVNGQRALTIRNGLLSREAYSRSSEKTHHPLPTPGRGQYGDFHVEWVNEKWACNHFRVS